MRLGIMGIATAGPVRKSQGKGPSCAGSQRRESTRMLQYRSIRHYVPPYCAAGRLCQESQSCCDSVFFCSGDIRRAVGTPDSVRPLRPSVPAARSLSGWHFTESAKCGRLCNCRRSDHHDIAAKADNDEAAALRRDQGQWQCRKSMADYCSSDHTQHAQVHITYRGLTSATGYP